MNLDLSIMPWLPAAPADFRARCAAVEQGDPSPAASLRALAESALSDSQLARLAKTIGLVRTANGGAIPGMTPFKLGLISNATTKLFAPAIVASAARYGIDLQVIEAEYNQVMQAATGGDSKVVSSKPNAILLALDHNGYEDLQSGSRGDANSAIAYLNALRAGLRDQFKGTLILQTLATPPETLFGSADVRLGQSQRARIGRFNHLLVEALDGSPDVVLDVEAISQAIGGQNWFDPAQWHIAKLPFAQRYVPLYAEHCARLLAAMVGKSRKCLVLDCDNTLWGGVIGDDGLDGIVLGNGSAVGEAFLAIQRMALDLRERGIILAVSSKNEDRIAREVFQKHPEMLLREEHIAVFQANWNDKATNLEAIAKALNIGIDSLVFLDDNPAERRQVRQALPQVAVPEIGDDPALYPRFMLAGGYFEALAFLDADRQRAEQYQANAKRAALQTGARDLASYLKSLDMRMTVGPFDKAGRSRITQLINKSNQFNLTTKRYTEAEIEQVGVDDSALTFQIRLADAFGDNGMISVIIVRKQDDDWAIDTWLMSCRVLGRSVERAALNEIAAAVTERGGTRLIGTYRPTDRNEMVADHYRKLGFDLVETRDGGTTVWSLDLDQYEAPAVPMDILRTRVPDAEVAA